MPTYDFFLSYATSDDDAALPGIESSKWVSYFLETLKKLTSKKLKRDVRVFLDRSELAGNLPLTDAITDALKNSHLFVAISTPDYYNRPWCEKERRCFIEGLSREPAKDGRVFVILHSGVDEGRTWQNHFFPDILGYPFYRKVDQTRGGGLVTLGTPMLSPNSADAVEYFEVINRLATEMVERIEAIESVAPGQAATQTVIPQDVVFLADNSVRTQPQREELRAALQDAGFDVESASKLPPAGDPPPTVAIAFVQLVSPVLVEVEGDGTQAITRDQRQWQRALGSGLPLFRWRSPDLDIDAVSENHPGYREFATTDVREQLFATFKADLLAELQELRETRRMKSASADDERLVLVAAAKSDQPHADSLTRLFGPHALGNFVTDTPAEQILAEDVKAYVVVYGGTDPDWIRDRLSVVRTLPKMRKKSLPVGVYFCEPPPTLGERPLLFDMPSFRKIRWDDAASFVEFAKSIPK